MAAGERRGAAGFAFRPLPQKAFPCLQDRDVRERLLKWWEGGGPPGPGTGRAVGRGGEGACGAEGRGRLGLRGAALWRRGERRCSSPALSPTQPAVLPGGRRARLPLRGAVRAERAEENRESGWCAEHRVSDAPGRACGAVNSQCCARYCCSFSPFQVNARQYRSTSVQLRPAV